MMPTLKEWLNRTKTKKPRKGLRKVSPRKQAINAQYNKQAKAFKIAHPVCQICQCTPTKDVHHIRRRGPFLLEESTWLAVCRWCHDHLHSNASWAREKGYLK